MSVQHDVPLPQVTLFVSRPRTHLHCADSFTQDQLFAPASPAAALARVPDQEPPLAFSAPLTLGVPAASASVELEPAPLGAVAKPDEPEIAVTSWLVTRPQRANSSTTAHSAPPRIAPRTNPPMP